MTSPFSTQQAKKAKVVIEKPLALFKPEKLNLTLSEARKVLHTKVVLGRSHIHWCQNWLTQRMREKSLPPQIAGRDAFSQIVRFLSPSDASVLFSDVRKDFADWLPKTEAQDDVSFLEILANEAYHEYQDQPQVSSHNSPILDASP